MVLAGSQNEYSCSSINAGYKIVIHENNLLPFPDADGYTMPYGGVTAFGLSQVRNPEDIYSQSSFRKIYSHGVYCLESYFKKRTSLQYLR